MKTCRSTCFFARRPLSPCTSSPSPRVPYGSPWSRCALRCKSHLTTCPTRCSVAARARTSRRSSRAACSHPLDTLAAPCRHGTRRRPVPGPRTRARGDIPATCRTHACSSGLCTPRTARGCWLHFLLCRAVAPLALCNQLPSLFLLNCCTAERPGSGRFTRCTEAMPVGD